jgi:archaellum component FlaC
MTFEEKMEQLDARMKNTQDMIASLHARMDVLEARTQSVGEDVAELTAQITTTIDNQRKIDEQRNRRLERFEKEIEHLHVLWDLQAIRQIVDRRYQK